MNPQKTVLLADGHPICRMGLSALIHTTADMSVCAETDSAKDAVQLINKLNPDGLVMGLSLNHGSGLHLIHTLRSQALALPILVMSMYDEVFFAERVIRAGANGYLQKSASAAIFLQALRQVLKGQLYLSPQMSEVLLRAHLQGQAVGKTTCERALSDRELEVYMLLGQGYTTKRIASELHLSPKTVDSHKEHIKMKLGITDNMMLIRRALAWEMEHHT